MNQHILAARPVPVINIDAGPLLVKDGEEVVAVDIDLTWLYLARLAVVDIRLVQNLQKIICNMVTLDELAGKPEVDFMFARMTGEIRDLANDIEELKKAMMS